MNNKFLAILLAVVIMLSFSVNVFAKTSKDSVIIDFGDVAGEPGDVDVDMFITSSDLQTLFSILLDEIDPQSVKTANVNATDGIDIRDLVRLKKVLSDIFDDYINYRTPLTHTYKRLTKDKELRVLYFGGSVTAGYGSTNSSNYSWRGLSGNWLKAKFPKANITTINTAIGESGTFLGTYRLQQDVIAKNPDLIFIEYAINDYYKGSSKEVAALQYETIVRELRTALPKCDIVTLLVTDKDVIDDEVLYASASGHEEMAEYYGISTVNVGQYLWESIGKSKTNWSQYYIDIVHPTNAGYSVYYRCLEEYLTNALLCSFTDLSDNNKTLPAIKSDHLLDGDRVAAMGSGLSSYIVAEETTGFTYSSEYFAGSDGAPHSGYYQTDSSKDNPQITFAFSGTEFAFWTNFKQTATISYSIDGGAWNNMACHEHAPTQITTALSSGDHVITIKPVTYPSGVNTMKIHAIFTRDATKQTNK